MTNRYLPFTRSKITGGFWAERYQTLRDVTAEAILKRFQESGRMEALRMKWRPGDPFKPHIFWESDVTKWIEGIAYLLEWEDLPELERYVDELIRLMEETQDEDGYLNTYFTVVDPEARFTRRVDHELYCAGHLIEAAVAYAESTGKTKLLDIACKYADLIDRTFRVEHSAAFDTPGHQEIELALYKLFSYTGQERYKLLADYFLEERGKSRRDDTYEGYDLAHLQSHLPLREQMTAEGHSVRALYMFAAMADQAMLNEDHELITQCQTLFTNIVDRRMYITGAIGSTYLGESFTYDYDLPSDTAYAETCASIALALFCRRMYLLDANGKYADIAEQAIYNTVLGGLSIHGDSFFYENPLSVDVKRHEFYASRPHRLTTHLPLLTRAKLFDCSCCPPNLLRFIASITDFMYSMDETTLYTQCYMQADSVIPGGKGEIQIDQKTAYPYDGTIELYFRTDSKRNLALRIPGWCESYRICLNETPVPVVKQNGFALIEREFIAGDIVRLKLDMPVRLMAADPRVNELSSKAAVMRGPLVYAAEGIDNPGLNVHDIRFSASSVFTPAEQTIDGLSVTALEGTATVRENQDTLYVKSPPGEEDCLVRLIPFFARANRGASDMTCWFRS